MRRGNASFSFPAFALCLLALNLAPPGAVAGSDSSPAAERRDGGEERGDYACWRLGEALEDLRRRHGLQLIWSSDVVWHDMQIRQPARGTPRQKLDKILEPFGLEASAVEGSAILLVVPGAGRPPARRPEALDDGAELLLPDWLDRSSRPRLRRFPRRSAEQDGAVEPEPEAAGFLIVEIDGQALAERFGDDFTAAAFALKEKLVALGAEGRGLRIALDGEPELLERLVAKGLAPYVHAYLHRSRTVHLPSTVHLPRAVHLPRTFVPSSDPSARGWLRSDAADGPEILHTLLDAAARGDQLVLFENAELDPLHHAFLQRIRQLDAADLGAVELGAAGADTAVGGIEPGRARLFYEPAGGVRYLAVYAGDGGQRLEMLLPKVREARRLFPGPVPGPAGALLERGPRLERGSRPEGGELVALHVPDDAPYQLFRLETGGEQPHRDLDVASKAIVDPYELVVANQVFQRRQRDSFRSLDVMEYLTQTPQYAGGDQITWEHRILQRRGKLTEYHHLGYWRNGSRYPEDKLLMGRLHRNEALVQLHPLEIELDRTYRYSYLGVELVDGHACHHIRFEPTREGSREDGTLVRGEVWLDETTLAHRRVRTYQEGLDGLLVYQDRTYHYEWLWQDGQCFWDWRRREGSYLVTSLGKPHAVRTETRREDFRYNREDIEQIARDAYEGDVMIHVETPPEGHRWLVKREGQRRLARRPDGWESYPSSGKPVEPAGAAPEPGQPAPAESRVLGDRVLANVSSYSGRAALSVGGFGSSGQSVDLYPGLVLTDQDLFGRDIFGYVGVFKDELQASISLPSVFGSKAVLTGLIDLPYDEQRNHEIRTAGASSFSGRDLDIDVFSPALTLAAAVPLRRSLTLDLAYTLRALQVDAVPGRDYSGFVLPVDTDEHVVDVELGWRLGGWQLAAGVELGRRQDWQAWGPGGSEPARSSYQVVRLSGFSSRRLAGDKTVGTGFSYFKGFDLDRFSRLPSGRARATVVGFATDVGWDEAVFTSAVYGASLWRRLPIHLQLEAGLSRFEGDGWQERAGLSFRFLVNGPLKTDLWPSVRYTLYSSVPGEEGELSYGLVIRRRY